MLPAFRGESPNISLCSGDLDLLSLEVEGMWEQISQESGAGFHFVSSFWKHLPGVLAQILSTAPESAWVVRCNPCVLRSGEPYQGHLAEVRICCQREADRFSEAVTSHT